MQRLYGEATGPTPILNSPDFDQIFGAQLPLDEQGLLRCVETIALPQTRFEILEQLPRNILRVRTNEYPGDPLFVDRRFLRLSSSDLPERPRALPKPESILSHVERLIGRAYGWGGNWEGGIPEMAHYYPPLEPLDTLQQRSWIMEGIDCSGLLYLATDGSTPRNTSDLVHYGKGLPIAGKTLEQIARQLQPLDLIAWKGHVVLVFDRERTAESRAGHGVIFAPLQARLAEVMKERIPVDEYGDGATPRFVIRRWC